MMTEILSIVGSTTVIYIALLAGLRLFGKKGLAQLSLTDVLFILLITEGVGDAIHMGNESIWGALVAAFTLILINKLFEWLLYRLPKFRRLVNGIPAVLVRDGKPDYREMRRNQVTIDDLEQAGRENGKCAVSDIKLAILEVDGKITVLDDDNLTTESPIKGLDNEDK